MISEDIQKLTKQAEKYSLELEEVIKEVQKVVVGQDEVIEKMIIATVADGHILLEGLPGLAKTLMIKTLSDTIDSSFKRIQFTPDLLPADIIGTKIYNQNIGSFSTKKGPIFANFILADEINRAPPKVQSALLEAMQERQVTIGEEGFLLEKPFFVMATQNPIETQGTYELPEAQVDRFMFKVFVDYPKPNQEKEIIKRMTYGDIPSAEKIISPNKIIEMQKFNRSIYMDDNIIQYITDIVTATRTPKSYNLDIEDFIEYGASPRASIYLALGGKAHAMLNQRGYVIPEDIKAIAKDVLRHRIILTYEALAEDITTDKIISEIINAVPIP
ncbi:MAG: AAA family ATPase [Methanosarcinales archaeon]